MSEIKCGLDPFRIKGTKASNHKLSFWNQRDKYQGRTLRFLAEGG